jgi:ankyrin repeat protein
MRHCLILFALFCPLQLLASRDEGQPPTEEAEKGGLPLRYACQLGWLNTVRRLVEEREESLHTAGAYGWTPLHMATLHGHEPVVQYLLEKKANPNCKLENGRTPLHIASFLGYEGIVGLLVGTSADLNCLDLDLRSPLLQAVRGKQGRIVALLIRLGANPVLRDRFGKLAQDYWDGG